MKKFNRSEQLAEKTDKHDGPMAIPVKCRDGIADALDAYDHRDALKQLGIVRARHVRPIEQ